MQCAVRIFKTGKDHELTLPAGANGFDLLDTLGFHYDTMILLSRPERQPIPLDEPLAEGATLELVEVVSGG